MNWQALEKQEVLRRLHTDSRQGISEEQARQRLKANGENRLSDRKKAGLFRRFLRQFQDFMVLILLAAAAVSFFTSFVKGDSEYVDSIIILAIVVVNAITGMIQESRAEKAIEALRKLSTPHARVVRGGKSRVIDSTGLVPGDLVQLEAGDLVPADLRIFRSQGCRAEESALTGESVPVEKSAEILCGEKTAIGDWKNMLFSGTSVVGGRAEGIVTATGMQTQMGNVAGMISREEAPETPLQQKLARTGKGLGLAALAICALIFVLGLFQHTEPLEMFMISVSLAVAAIPEGLPAVVTIVLAMGVRRMAARKAIIRRLPAVETLGSASVICSDKTGTLTCNRMTVTRLGDGTSVFTPESRQGQMLLSMAALCTNCRTEGRKVTGEPTEAALVTACRTSLTELARQFPRAGEIPFSSERKRMCTIHRLSGGSYRAIVKGAPDLLLERCRFDRSAAQPLSDRRRQEIRRMNDRMAGEALRVLGVAYRDFDRMPTEEEAEKDLVFCGLIGMIDPPRPEAARAVSLCRSAGIRVVMITGDHAATAAAIARQLGILEQNGKIFTGRQLDAMDDKTLEREVSGCRVFARVSPEHKVRIVRVLQKQGQVVAMTGDGVNDAPALRAADIGCAMGKGGTEVARAAADMVLTDDNFSTIVSAVEEGRVIYGNIRKTIHFLISCNIGEILLVLAAFLLGLPAPLLAIQLLWVNLVTDSLPALALGVEPAEPDSMKRKPVSRNAGVFSGGMGKSVILEGCLIGALALLAFTIGRLFFDSNPMEPATGRTMAFAVLSFSQIAHTFNMRSEHSLFTIGVFSNPKLILSAVICVLLQWMVIAVPAVSAVFRTVSLTGIQWALVVMISFIPIFCVEIEKKLFRTASKNRIS